MSTRALTEGAIMAGLAVVFALLGMVPLIGALAIFISGIPITIATARHGSFTGSLAAVLATLLIALILGPVSGLSYGLENMLLGFVIGYMLNKRKSGMKILQAGMFTAASAALILMIVSLALMGFTPDTIGAYYAELEAETMAMYESTGLIDAMIQQQGANAGEITAMMQSMVAVMVKLSPATMFLMGALNGAITYWLTMMVLKRVKVRIPRTTGFMNWRLPFSSVWVIIVVWTLWLMQDRIPFDWMNILIMNCMLVCAVLLFFNGITAAMHLMNYKEMTATMKMLAAVIFVMCFTFCLIGLIILGIADLLFDFRKKKVDNKKEVK